MIVNKIMCFLEGGYDSKASEKEDYSGTSKVSTETHKNNGKGLIMAKINFLLGKLWA